MLKILINVIFICMLGAIAEAASEPYCVRNESIIVKTPVIKTRQIIKKPSGFFKAFKKTKTYTESYQGFEEHVKVKAVRTCCEGYKMSRFDICQPFCESGCPKNALCTEPNVCQCNFGYKSTVSTTDGSHFCEPVCDGGCPSDAHCTAPGICECKQGFTHFKDRCVAFCSYGYFMNGEGICEKIDDIELYSMPPYDETTDSTFDPDTTTEPAVICPPTYIFYDGNCHPQSFASNETDCKFKPCIENAVCQDNGTCVCKEGFRWYKPEKTKEDASLEEVQAICLTPTEITTFLEAERVSELDPEDEIDWLSGCLIAFGTICILGVLCFFIVKFVRHKKQKVNIEVKNDMYCIYDSKDVPLVL